MSKYQPILTGGNILLRPLDRTDARTMFESLDDAEVAKLTGSHETFTFDAVERFCMGVNEQLDRFDYVICNPDDLSQPLGEMVLNEIDSNNLCANFRCALYGQGNFGRGLGSEAIALLMDFAFSELKLNRIELEVYEFNERAIHVYEKIGFRHEGRKREALNWQGTHYDALVMGLIASDWRNS